MQLLKILMSLALVFIGALVATETGSVLAGVVAIPLASYAVTATTGVSLFASHGLAVATLAALNRTPQQTVNPGGGRRLFLIPTDQITGEWPKRADITAGELTVVPTLVTGPPVGTFVEVQVSDNSLKVDEALKGPTGYQSWEQSLEVKVAGYTKDQVAAVEKLINTEVVAVAILNDGQRVVLGTSLSGLQFEVTHTSGAKGGDRREWTMKAKNDGYMFGYIPLGNALAIAGVTLA
ncbi:hypothetical protein GO755_39295 [Spirosoma sp. HMF4905]|uniref:Uncharacterized protein n=1 Tax=Spirosoma arboris TaxID=2682092 RepID=A0A7K1SQN5_9BACT|nr:hypothetical protein [Spirosoma arboris]MVM36124.1 hypothetical protein [Spirosoma arboris]